MRRRLVVSVVFALALASAMGAIAADSGAEQEFTQRINSERGAAGRAALSSDSEATAVARRHSDRMMADGRIYHNNNLPNEMDGWTKLGENVGKGYDIAEIHKAFMDSAAHRNNILDSGFTSVGVGVSVASDGEIYVTQIFVKRSSAPAPAAAEPRAPRIRLSGSRGARSVAPPSQPAEVHAAVVEPPDPQTALLVDDEPFNRGTLLAVPPIEFDRARPDYQNFLAGFALGFAMLVGLGLVLRIASFTR